MKSLSKKITTGLRANYQLLSGEIFTDLYGYSGNLKHLEIAVQNHQTAVDLTPQSHPDREDRLHWLCVSLTQRYERLGDIKDLHAALQRAQEAVNLTREDHTHRAVNLQTLAVCFWYQYNCLGDLKDLESALDTFQEALELTPEGNPDRASELYSLGMNLRIRYHKSGNPKDLDAAVKHFEKAVDATSKGHPHRVLHLHGLAVSLSDRYKHSGNPTDLEVALQKNQQVLELTPEGHPKRGGYLQSLASSLSRRYQRSGDLSDLEAAVEKGREAVNLTPRGHPERAMCLRGLAMSVWHRFDKLGNIEDLEAAVQKFEEVVNLTPGEHPARAEVLHSLAMCLSNRYDRLSDLTDLEAAIQKQQEVVKHIPDGHPDPARYLSALAHSLHCRYKRLGDLRDLEAALEKLHTAVDMTPKGPTDRVQVLHHIGRCLIDRYYMLGDLNDLEAAIQKNQEVVDFIPSAHPNKARYLHSLAASFRQRYHKNFQPQDCVTAYSAAFNLLPDIIWIGHSITVRHGAIQTFGIGQATSTAIKRCIDLSHIPSALEIMEQGLATILQQMFQLKSDVDLLQHEQAELFQKLSFEIYSEPAGASIDLVCQRNELLKDIRQQPGFECFLLPKPYSILRHASQGGPIVILNGHEDGCDAIIILHPAAEPVHVPLPNVTLQLLESHQSTRRELHSRFRVRVEGDSKSQRLEGHKEGFKPRDERLVDMLTWLWADIHNIHGGRLWWLPIGAFTGLPLHASPPTYQFIHSYTPTLGFLLDANNKKLFSTAPKFGVVGATHTAPDGMHALPGVAREIKRIQAIIGEPRVQCLRGEHATVDAVKCLLDECSWVHLACHGTQDSKDPPKSCFLLYGGNLELDTILRMPLPNAQFAFLAACQTATGDSQLMNESFHLGGGFIAAGFRGAIGTLWAMNDEDGPLVAEIFYSHLFREGREPQASDAAEALQLAIHELKKRKVSYERWIPFIHLGV
ncbi:CHAT domain-containing protein [Mycena vulgaris]|nr:CHAT domain-containing protein [Mycena vulgaris]